MQENKKAILKCENIQYKVNNGDLDQIILDDISFNIYKGEFVIILGKSGSGKTTLFNTIVGLIEPTSGNVFINDHNITTMSDDEKTYWRRYYFGYIFQNYGLFPTLNVYDNIVMSANLIKMYSKNAKKYFDTDEQKQRIDKKFINNVIEKLKLKELQYKFPHELSGGQQQRVSIARIFIKKPEIIFADEPTGALDDETTQNVMKILQDLNNYGSTIVMITHNEKLTEYATKIIRISDGKILSIENKQSSQLLFSELYYKDFNKYFLPYTSFQIILFSKNKYWLWGNYE